MSESFSSNPCNISQEQCPHALGKHSTLIETSGFVLTETKHLSNLSVTKHSHEHANIVCVLKGAFTENIGKRSFDCLPQNMLLKPADEPHSTRYDRAGAHCLIIEFQPEKLNYPLSKILNEVKHVQMAETFNLIHRIYREVQMADDVSEMAVEGLTLELLAHFTRQSRKRTETRNPRWLLEAKDFIHANFSHHIRLSAIAETIGVHPSHLARVFREQFHCSVGDYIRRLRLEYAAKQLIETEKTFVEIASAAGFYDQSHFANAFRKYTGLTPGEYRATKD